MFISASEEVTNWPFAKVMLTLGDIFCSLGSLAKAGVMDISWGKRLPPLMPPRSSSLSAHARSPGMPRLVINALVKEWPFMLFTG